MEPGGLATDTVPGEGTPLVFIHGWLGSKDSWEQVREKLELPNPKLFYDQRCHGDSPCEEFDFDDLAEDLHQLVERHGLEEPVLVGHSMGGMVALTYAVKYENLGGLFLLGTCASTPEPEAGSPSFYLERFGSMERREWAETLTDTYIEREAGEIREETVQQLVDAPDEPVVSGLRSMIEYDLRDRLGEVEVPAVVVGGERDGAITPEKSRELAELLDCPLEMLDSSHLMLQEVPGKVSGVISGFVEPDI